MKKEIDYYMYHDGLIVQPRLSELVEIAEPLNNELVIPVSYILNPSF